MRKVIVYELFSLDGVAENPDEFFDQFTAGHSRGPARPAVVEKNGTTPARADTYGGPFLRTGW